MAEQVLQLWERRENETQEAFEGFETYVSMGADRSLAKVAAQLGKSQQLMERWSARDAWGRRALAWDRHSSRIINERTLMGTADMRARQAAQGINMQIRAAVRVKNMTEDEMKRLKPSEIVALARAGAEMEARARAIPASELAAAERDDAPTFSIRFLPGKPEGMVSVRLQSGEAGYIPTDRVEEFLAEYPNAVVIQ